MSESIIEGEFKQSQDPSPHLGSRELLQRRWQAEVAAALSSVSSFDPTLRENEFGPERKFYSSIHGERQKLVSPPTEMSAAQAVNHKSGYLGVDIRPHLHDGRSGKDLLW